MMNICVLMTMTFINSKLVIKVGSEKMLQIGLSVQTLSGIFIALIAAFRLGFWAMAGCIIIARLAYYFLAYRQNIKTKRV
ncbi:hypothetical protein [Nicoletella semolina]|uniref:hypothetical protein n=1 Tax=Nicoletella semolina TaxID=271160 RepID=UPI001051653A|nr:hypothetical protein [Nicoletella semolina]